MDAIEAIMTRKSRRKFKSAPVSDEVLRQVLEAARWAPSWANTQCWRFIIVCDRDTRDKLATLLRPTNPSLDAIRNAPILIVACAELKKAGYYHGEPATDKGDWYLFDTGLAIQNLALAAHALGLGTVHVGSFNGQRAAEILGVPEGFCVVEMLPLGYPDGETIIRPRKELSEIVFYDKWTDRKEPV